MAAHLEEQQELDNFKYFWKTTGRWLFALLMVAALGYLGYTMYKSHKASKNQEAAAVLAKIVDKMQAKASQAEVNADLTNLQQNYPDSIAAAQATLMAAATEYDARRYDVAEGHLKWVLQNQKAPLVQALAAQRLGIVLLQQKKYDAAIAALSTKSKPISSRCCWKRKAMFMPRKTKPKKPRKVISRLWKSCLKTPSNANCCK